MNRLTQAIALHMLKMECNLNKLNLRLNKILFGKLATLKFAKSGKFLKFKNERNRLIKFASTHLKIFDMIKSHHSMSESINKPKLSLELKSLNSNDNSESLSKKQKHARMKVKISNQLNNFLDIEHSNTLKKFYDLSIPDKYVEHWLWLKNYFGSTSNDFKSYEKLLLNAYSPIEFVSH
jgi:hypothetical protein